MASNTVDLTKQFNIPADELYLLCGTAIQELKGKLSSTDPAMGKMKGTIGRNFLNAVCGIEVEVVPESPENCTLKLLVYPLNGYGFKLPFGGKGIAEKWLNDFVGELETRVKRFEIKYKK